MAEILHALQGGSSDRQDTPAMSDDHSILTGGDLTAKVAGLAEEMLHLPRVIGLLGANGTDWAVALLAAWNAGRTVVPMPTFFSRPQLEHVLRDAGVNHVLATSDAVGLAAVLNVDTTLVSNRRSDRCCEPIQGAGVIIYTSGSTGRPKGVRLELGQLEHSATMLAAATSAAKSDLYLSVLPLPLLLETICAICVPILVGARTSFDPMLSAAVARGQAQGIAAAFERHRPTTSVLVPELLAAWVGELKAQGVRAPETLRFVATGGAPLGTELAESAWSLGIPAYEGYGLSECCSVVAVNKPGKRKKGTVGQPLPGLDVKIIDGEIIVDGPTVMAGYVNGGPAQKPWHTGDLGEIDRDGYLTVYGRKDNLIVTSFGRNISPEWIEAMLLGDQRLAACAVLGHGAPHLRAIIIPAADGAKWFRQAPKAHVLLAMAAACHEAPAYAVPRDFVVVDPAEAARRNLLTPNGRFRRAALAQPTPTSNRAPPPGAALFAKRR